MSKASEIDILADHLPQVFDLKVLPRTWDEDWIIVPVESPEILSFPEAEDRDPFAEPIDTVSSNLNQSGSGGLLPDEMAGGFAGSITGMWDSNFPPPDALAFYLPFHYFHPVWWGIYLITEGVHELAQILFRNSNGQLAYSFCYDAARIFLFGHEQFHHCVESLATRLEVTHRVALYRTGFERFYRHTYGSHQCLEEALANANGLRRVLRAFDKSSHKILKNAFALYFQGCPPGYDRALEFMGSDFKTGERQLAEEYHKEALGHIASVHSSLWATFPHGFHPFRRRNSRVNYILHRKSPMASRDGLNGRYFRYRDITQRLRRIAKCTFLRQGKGSHEIWRSPNGTIFSIPRHPGEFPRGTLKNILRQAGVQMGIAEFMQA